MNCLDLIDYIEGMSQNEVIKSFYDLAKRHSENIKTGMTNMRLLYDDLYKKKHPRSFYSLILDQRRYKEGVTKPTGRGRKTVPSKGLKELAKKTCETLYNPGSNIRTT